MSTRQTTKHCTSKHLERQTGRFGGTALSAQPLIHLVNSRNEREGADTTLAQLKFNWRLAQDWQLITPGQFEHGIRLMEEVGRLLGAWLKAQRSKPTTSAAAARAAPAPENRAGDPPGP